MVYPFSVAAGSSIEQTKSFYPTKWRWLISTVYNRIKTSYGFKMVQHPSWILPLWSSIHYERKGYKVGDKKNLEKTVEDGMQLQLSFVSLWLSQASNT
jgi:hypothetical protein